MCLWCVVRQAGEAPRSALKAVRAEHEQAARTLQGRVRGLLHVPLNVCATVLAQHQWDVNEA